MLHLDARQRALLQEMGLMVWAAPTPVSEPVPTPVIAPAPAPAPAPVSVPIAQQPRRLSSTTGRSALAATQNSPSSTASLPALLRPHLGPMQVAYPQASSVTAAAQPPVRWLIVTECTPPEAPMTGEAGHLLDNLLRALRLQYNPEIFVCSVLRPETDAQVRPPPDTAPLTEYDLQINVNATVQRLSPAVILALGPLAARALLGGVAPLGQLRACVQSCAATPVVVTYPLSYLLRHPEVKPLAWADLCRAYALVAP